MIIESRTGVCVKTVIDNLPPRYTAYQVWVYRTGWRKLWHNTRIYFTDESLAVKEAERLAYKHNTIAKVIRIEL